MGQNTSKIDFIGIGARHAGTSWIFECLKEHPQICGIERKDKKFFSRQEIYKQGIDFYFAQFNHCKKEQIKGDYDVSYLTSNEAPDRIKKHFPEVKLIACLRNPVERAYSAFYFDKNNKEVGVEGKTFGQVIADKQGPSIDNGFYWKYLQKYLKLFPRDNILLLVYEDIEKDPMKFIQDVCRFLGVDHNFIPKQVNERINFCAEDILILPGFNERKLKKTGNSIRKAPLGSKIVKALNLIKVTPLLYFLSRKNRRQYWRKNWQRKKRFVRPVMEENDRSHLQDLYGGDIKNLENLINRDLSFWK